MRGAARGARRPWGLYIYAGFFLLFLYGPVLLLPLFSLSDGTAIAFPIRGFTLRWYRELAADGQLFVSLVNSLRVALVVAAGATLLGVMSAWALIRYRFPARRPIIAFIMLPLIVPGLVLGVSLLLLTHQLGIEPSLACIAFGQMVLCLPFATLVMMSRFQGVDRSLEEASRDLGVGPAATFFRVVLPIAWPGVLSSLLMTFTISFDEFILALFLSGSQTTLPVYLWGQLRFPGKLPSVLALATLILLFSFGVATLAERVRRMGRQNRWSGPL
jgi:spermidine/putrescine transport system permease protein